jgi:triosephosphate isomerase
MRRPILAGNWKMNTCRESAGALVSALAGQVPPARDDVEVVVCPPAVYIQTAVTAADGSGLQVGGQNVSDQDSGAFTGETSCGMLTDLGCDWVIVGHSERRTLYGETDALVNSKVRKAISGGLKVIVCVGELLEQRQAGETEVVLQSQMTGSLVDLSVEDMSDVVVAYEPVWAIGTGQVATDEQAQEVHVFLRNWLQARFGPGVAEATRILYGGSVKAGNAAGLLSQPDVDGALVGGASLTAEAFIPIIEAGAASVN